VRAVRLSSFAFADGLAGPVSQAVIELGDVTVLFGANDVGKTRVLRFIQRALSDPASVEFTDVYGIAADWEVAAFIDLAADSYRHILDAVDAVAGYADVLELPELDGAVRVAVSWVSASDRLAACRYGRRPADLDARTRDELLRALPAPTPAGALAPVRLEYLGDVDLRLLPEPIAVPTSVQTLHGDVARAITRLCYVLRDVAGHWNASPANDTAEVDCWEEPALDAASTHLGDESGGDAPADPVLIFPFEDAAPGDVDEPDPDWCTDIPDEAVDERGQPTWEWLVEQDGFCSRVHPVMHIACRALEGLAATFLPSFVTHDYRLEVTPQPPTAIARGDAVALTLMRLDTAPEGWDEDDALRIDLDQVASGYALWIELAVREALGRLATLTHILYHAARCLRLGDEERPEVSIPEIHAVVRGVLRQLRDPYHLTPHDAGLDGVLEVSARVGLDDDEPSAGLVGMPRSRVYLIDEPEQRLHPGLQRRAARWLTTLMHEWGSQCVLATHSLAFLPTTPGTHAYQITRTKEIDESELTVLDPATLTPYSHIAHAVGLTRGELLTRWRAFLFTDPQLAAILEQLIPQQLAAAQIYLTQLPENQGSPPAEIALLADLTAAPLIHLKLTRRNPPSSPGNGRPDDPASAALSAIAAQLELDIHTICLDAEHPFDLLHPTAIAHHQPPHNTRARFQDHTQAHHQHATTSPTVPYPEFLHAAYAITPYPTTITAIAQTMSQQQLPLPQALTDALWHIEQLLLAAESR
jgi:hypothetical protein